MKTSDPKLRKAYQAELDSVRTGLDACLVGLTEWIRAHALDPSHEAALYELALNSLGQLLKTEVAPRTQRFLNNMVETGRLEHMASSLFTAGEIREAGNQLPKSIKDNEILEAIEPDPTPKVRPRGD